jgi:hypothetical protein
MEESDILYSSRLYKTFLMSWFVPYRDKRSKTLNYIQIPISLYIVIIPNFILDGE